MNDGNGALATDEASVPTLGVIARQRIRHASDGPAAHGESWDGQLSSGRSVSGLRPSGKAKGAEIAHTSSEVLDGSLTGGVIWFEFILGILFGLTSILAAFQWSGGGLGPFCAVPALAFAIPLSLSRRKDLHSLGFGLVVSMLIALVSGLALWYAALYM